MIKKKNIIPFCFVLINSVLMERLSVIKTKNFLIILLINILPLSFIFFAEFFAFIIKIGFWQLFASDYNEDVNQNVFVIIGWISLILIFLILII